MMEASKHVVQVSILFKSWQRAEDRSSYNRVQGLRGLMVINIAGFAPEYVLSAAPPDHRSWSPLKGFHARTRRRDDGSVLELTDACWPPGKPPLQFPVVALFLHHCMYRWSGLVDSIQPRFSQVRLEHWLCAIHVM